MRRLECGAGRRRAWRFAPLLRRPMRETAAAGAAPARVLRTARTRAACSARALQPPAGSRLTDGGPCGSHGGRVPDKGTTGAGPKENRHHPRKARPDAAVKTPRWSAGRRAGPVWPVISGRLSGDGLDREAGHRVRRIRTSVFGAPSPLAFFLRARPKQARPARHFKRAAERWLARLEDRKDNRCRGREGAARRASREWYRPVGGQDDSSKPLGRAKER